MLSEKKSVTEDHILYDTIYVKYSDWESLQRTKIE